MILIIPKGNSFKNHYLRNFLLNNWQYSKHYIDSAIKQAYSILKSWRRNYIKGKRSRNKPIVKKKFVRVKEALYSYRNGIIKVSIKPYEKYLEFNISKAWFWSKVPKNANIGELILNEKKQDLKKEKRNITKNDWKTIITLMKYKAKVQFLNSYNSTKRCPDVGL